MREAARQKGPFWLRNSRGPHKVVAVHKVNARLYHVVCADGGWYALAPDHPLFRGES